jgi:hypothetical protein
MKLSIEYVTSELPWRATAVRQVLDALATTAIEPAMLTAVAPACCSDGSLPNRPNPPC